MSSTAVFCERLAAIDEKSLSPDAVYLARQRVLDGLAHAVAGAADVDPLGREALTEVPTAENPVGKVLQGPAEA